MAFTPEPEVIVSEPVVDVPVEADIQIAVEEESVEDDIQIAVEEESVEDDGLVEVITVGDVGGNKYLHINGVAVSIPCGIVLRVTPEAAEQLRQCNLI